MKHHIINGCVPFHRPSQPQHPVPICPPDPCHDHCHDHHDDCHDFYRTEECRVEVHHHHDHIISDLCACTTDIDYNRLHELVLKLFRFTKDLRDRIDAIDGSGSNGSDGNDGNNGNNGNNGSNGNDGNNGSNGSSCTCGPEINGLKGRVTALETTVGNHGSRITMLEAGGGGNGGNTGGGTGGGSSTGDNCNCQPQINALNSRVGALEGRVTALENNGGTGGDNPGTGGGTGTVVKSVTAMVFKQSATKPSKPTGGSYDFTNNTLTPPAGWVTDENTLTEENVDKWWSYNSFQSDGTDFGWSDPIRLTNIREILDKVDADMQQLYKDVLARAKQDLDKVEADAKQKLEEANDLIDEQKVALEKAKKDIKNAKDAIDEAAGQLEAVSGKVNKLDGKINFLTNTDEETITAIQMLAEYLNGSDGQVTKILADIEFLRGMIAVHTQQIDANQNTITELDSRMDTAEGTITLYGERINANDESINQAGLKIDAVDARVTQEAQRIDAANGEITTVKQDISAVDGKITTVGQRVDTVDGRVTTVKNELDAVNAKATTAASWVDTNKNAVNAAIQTIDGMEGKITQLTYKYTDDAVSAAKQELNAEDASIRLAVAQKVDANTVDEKIKAAEFVLTPEKISAAIRNNAGAGAAIVAAINANNESSVTIDADKIKLNGEVIAKIFKTIDLDINDGAAHFYPDGSGFVANRNIRWDKDGNISIGNNAITVDKYGSLSGMLNKYIDVTHFVQKYLPNGNTLDDPKYIGMAYGNGIFVCVKSNGVADVTSDEGTSFTSHTIVKSGIDRWSGEVSYTSIGGCNSVKFFNGYFYTAAIVNGNICVFRSNDGKTWTTYSLGTSGSAQYLHDLKLYITVIKDTIVVIAEALDTTISNNYLQTFISKNGSSWSKTFDISHYTVITIIDDKIFISNRNVELGFDETNTYYINDDFTGITTKDNNGHGKLRGYFNGLFRFEEFYTKDFINFIDDEGDGINLDRYPYVGTVDGMAVHHATYNSPRQFTYTKTGRRYHATKQYDSNFMPIGDTFFLIENGNYIYGLTGRLATNSDSYANTFWRFNKNAVDLLDQLIG